MNGRSAFRVWAPEARRVEVVFADGSDALPLTRDDSGYFSGATTGSSRLYKYRVNGADPWPDPCSRFQPQGVHGPSQIVAPDAFEWTDAHWRGVGIEGQVIYELHIGTFTAEGTFDSAARRLEHLLDVGVTVLEVMPVAQCPGRWNWGYDGVQLFAPYHVYGDHEAFKRFVDRAHALGLAVILDVVYNHLGPDGNYLKCFSPYYFSQRYKTEWGEPFNLDEAHSQGARDFIIGNACYWIREFHLDGFRLDATQSIFDSSPTHLLAELTRRARAAARPRRLIFIAEDEPQDSEQLLPTESGGFGIDAMWNDDFHHSARVALTGSRDGYFHDYSGRSQELLSCVRRGFLYQGQWYAWQKKPRGMPIRDRGASACVVFLQNHDQVGNTATGLRIHTLCAPHGDRLLLVNLAAELTPESIAEPLLAPPRGQGWQLLWSSESPDYGGQGSIVPVADHGRGPWRIQARSAVLLIAAARIVVSPPRPEVANDS